MTTPIAPTYEPHLRLTCSGVFQGLTGAAWEQWSFRLNLSDSGATMENFTEGALDDKAADLAKFFAAPGARVGQYVRMTEVKLARIGANGKYTAEPLIKAMDVRGSATGATGFPQIALAVSLDTDRRGPSGRGRFYIPGPFISLDVTTGLIPQTTVDEILLACQTLLNDLNNAAGLDFANSKVTIASGKGFNSDVKRVRVGRVADTIRSRRNQILENYTAPLPVT